MCTVLKIVAETTIASLSHCNNITIAAAFPAERSGMVGDVEHPKTVGSRTGNIGGEGNDFTIEAYAVVATVGLHFGCIDGFRNQPSEDTGGIIGSDGLPIHNVGTQHYVINIVTVFTIVHTVVFRIIPSEGMHSGAHFVAVMRPSVGGGSTFSKLFYTINEEGTIVITDRFRGNTTIKFNGAVSFESGRQRNGRV